MSDLAIETQSLRKQYRDLAAVDSLDLHVPRGSIYGFLGRNGAGKTTTIRMLAGLARPTGGSMRVLTLDPEADRIAMLERTGIPQRLKPHRFCTPGERAEARSYLQRWFF